MRVAQLTLEQGLFRLDRLTKVLSWLLPTQCTIMTLLLIGSTDYTKPITNGEMILWILAVTAGLLSLLYGAMWISRATKNLILYARPTGFHPVVAWLVFIIPIVNLVAPWYILRTLHRRSFDQQDAPRSVLGFSIGWTLSNLLSPNLTYALRVPINLAMTMAQGANIAQITASLCFLVFIRSINACQQSMPSETTAAFA